jgi:hypothetical protein
MTNIANLSYFEIEIDKFGNLIDPQPVNNLPLAGKRDLFVMAHGWNSDIEDARGLYRNFFTQFSRTLGKYAAAGVTSGQCAVMGILWPSEKYVDASLIPGGAAGIISSAEMLLRDTTYHLMKDRAGIVGRGGVASTLDQIQSAFPGIRIHLTGHSFGCRLVASAAAVTAKPIACMALFQAAFSHNSFSPDYDSTHQPGGFRDVITERKCEGPMLITHSVNDEALGLGYPIASRIFGQNSSSLGDVRLGGANDVYGALGRNGARHTPEASDGDLLAEGADYSFAPGRIFNLRADRIIQSHADIVKPETAWALIAAAGLGRISGRT